MSDELPTFDGPRFARWLRKWKQAERLRWDEIAARSGLSKGGLAMLARGTPGSLDRKRGQTEINPGINSIARLAHGLGLEFAYVASRAGLTSDGDRWGNFTSAERAIFVRALRDYSSLGLDGDPAVLRLLAELEEAVGELLADNEEVHVNGR